MVETIMCTAEFIFTQSVKQGKTLHRCLQRTWISEILGNSQTSIVFNIILVKFPNKVIFFSGYLNFHEIVN